MVSGELKEVGILEILQALSGIGQSGTLRLQNGEDVAKFRIQASHVVAGSSTRTGLFGERLVRRGLIAREALDAVMRVQRRKKAPQPLGALVCDLSLAPREDVEAELEAHVRAVIADVIRWTGGSFSYRASEEDTNDNGLSPDGLRIDSLLVSMLTEVPADALDAAVNELCSDDVEEAPQGVDTDTAIIAEAS